MMVSSFQSAFFFFAMSLCFFLYSLSSAFFNNDSISFFCSIFSNLFRVLVKRGWPLMEPPVGNKFRIGRKICGRFFGKIYLGGAAAVAKGKRRAVEELVDKATLQKQRHMIKSLLLGPGNVNSFLSSSFQYPIVKIGTEDQSFIDSVMDLGNSRGGKSSCNLISNSYKVMHEVQQPGTGKSQQDRSNFFSSTNASALYKPFAALSTGMKRLSPYDNSAVDAYPKKTRAVINKGEYERSKVVSTAQKVDVIAYPQNKMGEKCICSVIGSYSGAFKLPNRLSMILDAFENWLST
ncbi:hypothetical protein HN51_011853 [Arachis hypogaea]